MKLGIFVGSFNPVHKGHIKIANYILNKKLVDRLLIIPTGNYWDKKDIIDIKHRVNMLNNYKNSNLIIEEGYDEIPYTYMVINKLRNKYKEDTFYLIMGADNIVSFDKWKNYKELIKLNFIIYKRNEINIEFYLDKLEKTEAYIIIDKVDNIDISSTAIRNLIREKKDVRKYLDKKVIDYINKNDLYK